MELKQIIEALKEKEVESTVIDAIKELDQTDAIGKLTKDLEAEKGKNAGILEDKKKFKTRAEEAEKSLKEIEDSKLSVEERTQAKLDELQKKLEDAETQKIQQENDFKAQRRDTALSDITSSIPWSKKAVPRDTAKLIVKNAFSDVENLEDKSVVEAKIKELTDSHKSLISAEAPSGTGGKSGGSGGGGSDEVATMNDLMASVWGDK